MNNLITPHSHNNSNFFITIGERANSLITELLSLLNQDPAQKHLVHNFFLIFLNPSEKENVNHNMHDTIVDDQLIVENFEGFNIWVTDYDRIQVNILNPVELWLRNNLHGDYKSKIKIFILASLYSGTSQSIIAPLLSKLAKIYKFASFYGVTLLPTSIENTGPIELYSSILGIKNFSYYKANMLIDYIVAGKYFFNLGLQNERYSDLDVLLAKLFFDLFISKINLADIFDSMQIYDKLNLFYFVISQPNIAKKTFIPERGDLYKNWFSTLHSLLYNDFIPTKGNNEVKNVHLSNSSDFALTRFLFAIGERHDMSYFYSIFNIFANDNSELSYFNIPPVKTGFIDAGNSSRAEIILLENSTIILYKLKLIQKLYLKNISKKAYLHMYENIFDNIEEELSSCSEQLQLLIDGYSELFL